MVWKNLTSEEEIGKIIEKSKEHPVIIFKHSTRCPISSTALNRLERAWSKDELGKLEPYYLDLITYRSVSNKIAEVFQVQHESPQLLLIHNGSCTYDRSHMAIAYKELKENLAQLNKKA